MITFRPMSAQDIPTGLSLCRAAGWNQCSQDWELFLQLSPDDCLVALDEDEKVVGTVATVRYQDHFSWIGMVLVDQAKRKQGIGLQLLKESLEILKKENTVKLDATPAGREIYLKLDFVDEYPVSRMLCNTVNQNSHTESNARPAEKTDLTRLISFDRETFGADRLTLLEWMLNGAPHLAFLMEEIDEIKGFCLGRRGHNYMHIGPVVARDFTDAINLVSAAMRNCGDQPIILDVLHHTPEWLSWLTAVGFVEQRPFIRMFKGSNVWPGVPENQFAILGPEFG